MGKTHTSYIVMQKEPQNGSFFAKIDYLLFSQQAG